MFVSSGMTGRRGGVPVFLTIGRVSLGRGRSFVAKDDGPPARGCATEIAHMSFRGDGSRGQLPLSVSSINSCVLGYYW